MFTFPTASTATSTLALAEHLRTEAGAEHRTAARAAAIWAVALSALAALVVLAVAALTAAHVRRWVVAPPPVPVEPPPPPPPPKAEVQAC